MVLMHRLAVIGDIDSVVLFKAVGAEVFPVTSADEAGDVLVRLADEQYAIVCITEQFGDELLPLVERYSDRPAPAVVFIPSNKGSTGHWNGEAERDCQEGCWCRYPTGKRG